MSAMAQLYRSQKKYEQAELLYVKLLDLQRRVLRAEDPKRRASMGDLALVYLHEGKYAEWETLLQEALNNHQKSVTDTWERYSCQSMLGASLALQKKYAEAEAALLSGYEGMLQREAAIPAASRFKLEQAGAWITQLYQHWGRQEKAVIWAQKLSAAKPVVPTK